jgi:hypothetical protein
MVLTESAYWLRNELFVREFTGKFWPLDPKSNTPYSVGVKKFIPHPLILLVFGGFADV